MLIFPLSMLQKALMITKAIHFWISVFSYQPDHKRRKKTQTVIVCLIDNEKSQNSGPKARFIKQGESKRKTPGV